MFDFFGNNRQTNSDMDYLADDGSITARTVAGETSRADFSTLQSARRDLIGEIQAIIDYDAHIRQSGDRVARSTWEHVMHEEMMHVGELLALLDYLDPTQKPYVLKGIEEFNEEMRNI